MTSIRFFHEINGDVHELPDGGHFPYERGLQEFFEKHLRTLTGIDFLASEYSTGKRHGRRIDTLGIDGAGRLVVVEYKRRQDENVINQGLDYLAWLEDHKAEFRELVRDKLGDGRVERIDIGAPRLLCIAGEFLRQDRIAAENSRRRVDLLRYRRFGEAYVALEWVHGGEAVEPRSKTAVSPRPSTDKRKTTVVRHPENPDYFRYPPWTKISEETRKLFLQLETFVESLGRVRTDVSKSVISIKCLDAPGRQKVLAYVYLYIREVRIRLEIPEKHVSDVPLEDGFSRHSPYYKELREITVRNDVDIRKAERALRAAHHSMSGPAPR